MTVFFSPKIKIQISPRVGSYIDVADVELLGCIATLQVASGVDVVVSDNSGDYVRRRDSLRPLRRHKHPW